MRKIERDFRKTFLILILIAVLGLGVFAVPGIVLAVQCNDGIDNDNDGLTDYHNDPGCLTPSDNNETDETYPGEIKIEAESGGLGGPMRVIASDPNYPGSTYIESSEDDKGTAAYTFNISQAGKYVIYAQASANWQTHTGSRVGSFTVYVDDLPGGRWTIEKASVGAWRHEYVGNCVLDPYILDLSAGAHSLKFKSGTKQTKLNYFIIRPIAEENILKNQCENGIDDDGDGKIDFGEDDGCLYSEDDDEGDKRILPVNPNASDGAKSLLKYFYALPSRTDEDTLISGQHFSKEGPQQYERDVQGTYDLTGYWPGVLAADYYHNGCLGSWYLGCDDVGYDWNHPKRIAKRRFVTDKFIEQWENGGLVSFSGHLRNPVTGDDMFSTLSLADLNKVLDPNTQDHANWLRDLDFIAEGLQELEDAGVVVIYRPLHEMSGGWFWWGGRPDQLKALWHFMYGYLTNEKGLDNLLWMFHPASGCGDTLAFYPGDDYVDLMSFSVFTCDPGSDNNAIINYERLKSKGKPIAIGAGGPGDACIKNNNDEHPNSTMYDYRIFLNGIKEQFPEITYFAAYGHRWSFARNAHAQDFLEDSLVMNRGEIDYFQDPADINSDGTVNSSDIQLCVNIILEVVTIPPIEQAVIAKAKAVVPDEPENICNSSDLQAIVNEILK